MPTNTRNAGLDEAQAGIKIAGRNINNLRYANDTTLTAESEEELKSLLMKVKEENNRMGKTRDLFKKIREAKGTFQAKMGTRKDRNGMDLTEAEDIKKTW